MFEHIAQIQYKAHIWQTPNTEYQHKQLISSFWYGGGGVMIWAYFAGTWEDVVIELTMTPSVYLYIHSFIGELKLGTNWGNVTGQYLKHIRKSTTEWLKKK